MAKFFVSSEDVFDTEIKIQGSDVNHIKNVLRLPVGKEITISDRQGREFECIIKEINVETVTAQIKNVKENDIVEISFGEKKLKIKVLSVREVIRKNDASELYEVLPE